MLQISDSGKVDDDVSLMWNFDDVDIRQRELLLLPLRPVFQTFSRELRRELVARYWQVSWRQTGAKLLKKLASDRSTEASFYNKHLVASCVTS